MFSRQRYCGWFGSCLICWIVMLLPGCGGTTSQKDSLEKILLDSSLSEADKLEKLARNMFDLEGFVLAPAAPIGHIVELQVRANSDEVVRQVMKGKSNQELNRALKEFHFRSLNLQLADYLRRAKDLHLQELIVSLRMPDATLTGPSSESIEKYRLVLKRDKFEAYLAIANLRVQESLPKSEAMWQTINDGFR